MDKGSEFMKTGRNIVWGIVLVVLGVLLGINALGIFDFDIFFDGWWTLFIIIPSFVGLFADDSRTSSIIFFIIGILLLLACQDIIDFILVGKLILPIIIVTIGLALLFKNMIYNNISKSIDKINKESKAKEEYSALFAGEDVRIGKEEFHGTSVKAIFGGIKLDLRDAIIKEDIVITCNAVFGGVDVYLPDNVKVEIKSNSIFGGVDNKNKYDGEGVTVYIDATCVFGGIDVK